MAEDRWIDARDPRWERERRRERPENQQDYGSADYAPNRGEDRYYADRPAPPAGRGSEAPRDDRGYRPFGDTGPIYTASGAYGPDGERYGPNPDYRARDYQGRETDNRGYRRFEAQQRVRHGGDYDPDRYTPNPREGRGQETRSWWDRTQDELSAWFGDDEAKRRRDWDERRAEAVGEHRGRGPKGYRRSDERILHDINDRLTDDPHLDASDIEVAVSEGEATLSGVVFRREDKRRAEDLAEAVSGVTHVQNNLRLKREDGGTLL